MIKNEHTQTKMSVAVRSRIYGALVGAISVAVAAPAFSQGSILEETVVTARKRAENIQEVPITVTVLNGEHMENVGIYTLEDATAMVPNLRIAPSGTGPSVATLYIRGIGYNGTEKLESPSVGVFIDDLYWGMGHGQLVDAFDIESLQVLRGPQSTLYGKNTSGGAIIVSRTKPTGEPSLKVKAGAGDYGQSVVQILGHTPEVAGFSAKLGYTRKDYDGWAKNLYDGSDEGEDTYEAIHGMVQWDPTDDFRALLVFDDITQDGEATPLANNNDVGERVFGAFWGGGPLNPGVDYLEVWPDLKSTQELDVTRVSLKMEWDTPIGTISSITAYLDEADYTLQDFDSGCGSDLRGLGCDFRTNPLLVSGSNPTGNLHTIRDQDFTELTQELRITSEITDNFLFMGGLYYYEDEIGSRQTTNFIVYEETTQDTTSYAGFVHMTWDFAENWSISGGAQYIKDEKDHTKKVNLLDSLPAPLGGLVLLPLQENDREWDETVFSAALEWAVTDDNNLFLSVSDGFRSGGFSARGTAAEQIDPTQPNYTGGDFNYLSFEPETTRQWEIGSKNVFMDGAVVLNLTAFYTEMEDLQLGSVVLTPTFPVNTNSYINNYQESTYQGFEAELSANIPGIDGLSVTANFGLLDAEIDKAEVPAVRLPVGPGGVAGTPDQGSIDVSDTQLLHAADYTYALGFDYTTDIGPGTLGISGLWSYTDDVALVNLANDTDVQEGFGLLNGSIRYYWGDLELALVGQNLLDEEYKVSSLGNVIFTQHGSPRSYLATVTYTFH